ncbi:hypothetical protein PPS11_26946 [Pseudomonas putida S11]|nr:hypothetical protein PPS11_26946 [Pseudomonas putida S11]
MAPLADGFVYASLAQLMALELRIGALSFIARQPLSSILAGGHASRLRGRGLSFDELRRYQPGDDLRHLDWRASLRFGKPFVRTFTEERDRPTWLLVDQRMSMFFGSQRSFKSVVAAELAAISAWMALHAGDRVGGLVFDDQQVRQVRPLRSRARVEALCAAIVGSNQALSATGPDTENERQLDTALRQCIALTGHDALVCIISDFAGVVDADPAAAASAQCAQRRDRHAGLRPAGPELASTGPAHRDPGRTAGRDADRPSPGQPPAWGVPQRALAGGGGFAAAQPDSAADDQYRRRAAGAVAP